MKKRLRIGLCLGLIAGVVDVIPMLLQRLPWWATTSAFLQWIVIGILVVFTRMPFQGPVKGLVVSFMVLLPTAILIAVQDFWSLIPISCMTALLGSILGYGSDTFLKTHG